MSTPNKRRKKNDIQVSPQAGRSLDYFFGKQKQDGTTRLQPELLGNTNDLRINSSQDVDYTRGGIENDEDLARRLQNEWNQSKPEFPAAEATNSLIQSTTNPDDRRDSPQGQSVVDTLNSADRNPVVDVTVRDGHKATLSLQAATAIEDMISLNIPFDENPLVFRPSTYIPDLKRQWAKEGGDAPYALLTRCFVLVNSTQSRIKIVDTLVNLLRTIIEADQDSLLPTVWLATNSISPPYISLELGLGGSAISKALKKVCGLDNSGLKSLYNKHGDAGDVAFEAKKRQSFTLRKPKPLTIKGVFQGLVKVANSKGNGSQKFKQRIVERLLQDAQGAEESRYIVRTLVQHLRIGAVRTTMLIALSRAFLLSRPLGADFAVRFQDDLVKLRKEALAEIYSPGEELVKACFAKRPNYNDLIPCLLEVGIADELLVRCGLALHIPLRPMLGSITRDLGEMLTKLQGRDFSCEYKYDGQRAQVHCDDKGKVSIFSRHLEVMTGKYPDLVALVPQIRGEGVGSFILEGEVVAVDQQSGELKPFQTLTNRAKKDVDIGAISIDVCLFSFDLMYLNGESLLERSFRERRELLRSLFVEIPNKFTWVRNIDASSTDSETVLEFFKSATEFKCEGIMVKVLDNTPSPAIQTIADDEMMPREEKPLLPSSPATLKNKRASKGATKASVKAEEKEKGTRRKPLLSTYEPDKRLDSWLKVKKDYNTSADTLDLVPVAAWHGSGRKAKWWSPILLAVKNPENGSLEAVTKCISGFTDKFYQANKEKYAEDGENVIPRPGYVDYNGCPDVWFEPQEVWEMAFADITLSPTYTAAIGLVSEERGLSMRFPRFLKVREDKSIEEASTPDFLASLWRKQEARVQTGGERPKKDEEEHDEDDNA
ncbi:hypothetical protein MMC09_002419 [Bachmanniomyces sp. S44760]|nr:hypothetical protein [Bachmanniomyces sp. S44760]